MLGWQSFLVLLTVVASSIGAARATLVVPIPPEKLAARAPMVVTATVERIRGGRDEASGHLGTYVELAVEEVHRGPELTGFLLRRLGGTWDDLSLEVAAAPRFELGERVFVYLTAGEDGVLRTYQHAQGKLVLTTDPGTGETLAERMPPYGTIDGEPEVWPLADLLAQIDAADPDGILPLPDLRAFPRNVTFFPEEGGADFAAADSPHRWPQADADVPLIVDVDPTGDPLGDPLRSIDRAETAFAAWSDVAEARVEVALGNENSDYIATHPGQSPAVFKPIDQPDGFNVLLFDDPYDDLDEPIDCTGTLVSAGAWISLVETTTVNNVTFADAAQGWIILADGWNTESCTFLSDPLNVEEAVAHGLGRVLGLGTSNVADSILRAFPYGERGARLGSDDVSGVQCLYPHSLTLAFPDGGESFLGGASTTITWASTTDPDDAGAVDLQYSADGGETWTDVAVGVANSGALAWSVPNVDTASARVRVHRPLPGPPPSPFPASCAESSSPEDFSITFVDAAPGEVPDGDRLPGSPLTLDKDGDAVRLSWGASCGPAVDYAVYEGSLASLQQGIFDHVARSCSGTTGRTLTLDPEPELAYYLVVPLGAGGEGLYGIGTEGRERPRAIVTCTGDQDLTPCE